MFGTSAAARLSASVMVRETSVQMMRWRARHEGAHRPVATKRSAVVKHQPAPPLVMAQIGRDEPVMSGSAIAAEQDSAARSGIGTSHKGMDH